MIELAAALAAVTDVLDRNGVDHLVVGSTAAAAWGVARTTRDVDVVVMLPAGSVDDLLAGLAGAGLYVPMAQARAAAASKGSFNVLDPASGGKVDLFVVGADDTFELARLRRRIRADVLGVPAWVATAEDVVLAKLRWRVETRSETQWRDCVEIAASNDLDRTYLRSWSADLGIAEDLEELLAAVDGA